MPEGGNVIHALSTFTKRLFEPGVCMGAREKVIKVIVYDGNLQTLVGEVIQDDDLRILFHGAPK
jgi:hypothetical protein